MNRQPLPILSADPGAPGAPDQRAQPRLSFPDPQLLVRVIVKPSFQPFWAFVKDVSSDGVGLVLDRPLPPGTVMAVQAHGRGAQAYYVGVARVVHVMRADSDWVVGCKFSRPLTDEDLQDFLGEEA